MKPVFKEEMKFLGIDMKYEGFLWVDKRAYRAFNKEFELVKYGRKISNIEFNTDDMVSHKDYADYYYNTHTKDKVERERESDGLFI